MRNKTIRSIIILYAISLLPLIPWYFLSPIKDLQLNYENITHSLGQMSALIGMTLFALTFVLSTRLRPIEKAIGGLDKVYHVHSMLGSSAFMLILAHPILLILKFIPTRVDLAAKYLLPGHGLSVDFGIIGIVGMIILLGITFYINMRYHYWKMSHKFLGLSFIFAILHIFLVRGTASRDNIFDGYYIYATIVSLIGLISFIYSLNFKSIKLYVYKVKSIDVKNKINYDIVLEPMKRPMRYKAGQFAFFRFHNKSLGKEFHPYSIASPTDGELRIIIKSLGDYTEKIKNLNIGDMVSVEGPYGEFTIKNKTDGMVWISAGIGITPFIGMAKDVVNKNHTGNTRLFYCAKEKDDLIMYDEMKILENSGRFEIIPWCSDVSGRISLKDIGPINDLKVYICGPEGFKAGLIEQLHKEGISDDNIFHENFGLK